MSETYVRPTTCNRCGGPRSHPLRFLCDACRPKVVTGVDDFDDMDEWKDNGDGGLGSGKWLFDGRDIGDF